MDYQILFSQRSLGDLAEILSWIAEDDPDAASHFGASLLDHIELLSRFPLMGNALGKRRRIRKLSHSPIMVYYDVHEDRRVVEILHFRHASRQTPEF